MSDQTMQILHPLLLEQNSSRALNMNLINQISSRQVNQNEFVQSSRASSQTQVTDEVFKVLQKQIEQDYPNKNLKNIDETKDVILQVEAEPDQHTEPFYEKQNFDIPSMVQIDYQFYAIVQKHCILKDNHRIQPRSNSVMDTFGPRSTSNKQKKISKDPFAIYGLEIHTPFSKMTLKKTFSDFSRLHKILHQLRDSKLEQRDQITGRLKNIVSLKDFLPILPKNGRSFFQSWWQSQPKQNPNDLIQAQKMAKLKNDLSTYCQQLLLLVDIFFIHNLKLKEIKQLRQMEKYQCNIQKKINTPNGIYGSGNQNKYSDGTFNSNGVDVALGAPRLSANSKEDPNDLDEIKNEQAEDMLARVSSGLTNSDPAQSTAQILTPKSSECVLNTDAFNSSHIIEGEDIQKQHKILQISKTLQNEKQKKMNKINKIEKYYIQEFVSQKSNIDGDVDKNYINHVGNNIFQYLCKKPHFTNMAFDLQTQLQNDEYLWAQEIISFFDVQEMFENELASIKIIERFFMNCKRTLLKIKFQKMIYKLQNMCSNVLDLPDHILVLILEYFTEQERFKNQNLCKKLGQCLQQPYLYKSIKISNNSVVFSSPQYNEHFSQFVGMANQLKVISLKYCANFSKGVLNILNLNCNPFVLSELYLDGCEGVNDSTFECLMLSKEEEYLIKLRNGEPIEEEKTNQAASDHLQNFINSYASSSQNLDNLSIQNPSAELLDTFRGAAIALNNSLISNQANNDSLVPIPELKSDQDEEPLIQKTEKVVIELGEAQRILEEKYLNQNNINKFLARQSSDILNGIHLKNQQQVKEIVEEEAVMSKDSVQSETFKHLSRGGLRGLTILSLAECRNVSDLGIERLSQLRYLQKLSLLWCTKVEDEGLKSIYKQFEFIEDLDLGGTSITSQGLRDLVKNTKYFKKASIMGCKKLNVSDDQILTKKNIQCQGVDDVFRFHLLPELTSSDLPQITKSVLKTRSTLGLNKVYKYLFRRLLTLKIEDLVRDPNDPNEVSDSNIEMIVPEEKIEILCNGNYLKPTLQLKEVKELYWQGPYTNPNHTSDLLILQYRRKFSKTENLAIAYDDQYRKRKEFYQSKGASALNEFMQQPKVAVPPHLGLTCQNPMCGKMIDNGSMLSGPGQINCQRCGNCFCQECCSYIVHADTEFGFQGQMRCCRECQIQVDSLQQTQQESINK